MSTIQSDAIDYNRKIGLLRTYAGYYSEEDYVYMFGTTSLTEILENCSYSVIKARLMNTLSNTLDKDIEIGDVVTINKPTLKNGVYRNIDGLVLGKHMVYDEYDKNRAPIYHMAYDILIQSEVFIDGYTYEVRRENAEDLTLKEVSVAGLDTCMALFNSIVIDRPV